VTFTLVAPFGFTPVLTSASVVALVHVALVDVSVSTAIVLHAGSASVIVMVIVVTAASVVLFPETVEVPVLVHVVVPELFLAHHAPESSILEVNSAV
jgi:hypothetical protein